MAVNNSALVAETVPKPFQVRPSVEYCQLPFPMTLVTAMPLTAPLSTSAQAALTRIALTAVAEEVVFSSVAVKVTLAVLVMVGASLTAVTVSVALAAWLE